MPTRYFLQPATATDRASVIDLLNAMQLPTVDLPATLDNFVLAKSPDLLIGTGGLEVYGSLALLRSLAVAADQQGRGVGTALYRATLELAKSQGVQHVFLITDTAAAFFEQQGFKRVARAAVPVAIQQTAQFTFICPSSAVVLSRELN